MQIPGTDTWENTDLDQLQIDDDPDFNRILKIYPDIPDGHTEEFVKDDLIFRTNLDKGTTFSRKKDDPYAEWERAKDINGKDINAILVSGVNGYQQILTAPDGTQTKVGKTTYYVKDTKEGKKIFEKRFLRRDREVTSILDYNPLAQSLNDKIPSTRPLPSSFPGYIPLPDDTGTPYIAENIEEVSSYLIGEQQEPESSEPPTIQEVVQPGELPEEIPQEPPEPQISLAPKINEVYTRSAVTRISKGTGKNRQETAYETYFKFVEDLTNPKGYTVLYKTSLPDDSGWKPRPTPAPGQTQVQIEDLLATTVEGRADQKISPVVTILTEKDYGIDDEHIGFPNSYAQAISPTTAERRNLETNKLEEIYIKTGDDKVMVFTDTDGDGVINIPETFGDEKPEDYRYTYTTNPTDPGDNAKDYGWESWKPNEITRTNSIIKGVNTYANIAPDIIADHDEAIYVR